MSQIDNNATPAPGGRGAFEDEAKSIVTHMATIGDLNADLLARYPYLSERVARSNKRCSVPLGRVGTSSVQVRCNICNSKIGSYSGRYPATLSVKTAAWKHVCEHVLRGWD